MAQEQAPEVGQIIDGYRFKGGDPAQESSWEQASPIAAPEYGNGAQRLPNGAVVRYGPRGGMQTIVTAAQAAGSDAGQALVGADARARFMVNLGPLLESQNILDRMDREGYNPSGLQNTVAAGLEAVPFDGGYAARRLGGEDYNAYNQAAKTFEAAILPIMSGAAVTPTEAQRMIRAALPQPGDTPEVLTQKAVQRRQMINGVAQGIGQPAPFEDPRQPSSAAQEADVGPADPATGLPTYPTIQGGQNVGGDLQTGPGASQDDPIDFVTAPPEQVIEAVKRGGWFRQGPDGVPYQLPPSEPQFRQPGEGETLVQRGVAVSPTGNTDTERQMRARAAAQERVAPRDGDASSRYAGRILSGTTFGLIDEITRPIVQGGEMVRNIGHRLAGEDIPYTSQQFADEWIRAHRDDQQAFGEREPLAAGALELAGGVATGTGAARAVPQVLRQAPRVAGATINADRARRAANVARASAGGAAGAGAYGFGSSEGDLAERGGNALQAAAIGGVLAPAVEPIARPIARVVARPLSNALGERAPSILRDFAEGGAVSPRQQQVQTLRDYGVNLTPGQRAGGIVGSVEDLAQRAPILGPAIRGARRRGEESLNRAVGNRALDYIGEGVPRNIPAGGEMVDYVRGRLGQEIENAYALVPEFAPDEAFSQNLAAIGQRKSDLPETMQKQFDTIIDDRLSRLGAGATGEQAGRVRSELSNLAAGYSRSPDAAQQGLGGLLSDVADEIDNAVGRANPEAAARLVPAREGYSDYIRMERASTAANGSPFSPSQLASAVRQSDSSVRRNIVGRGGARMQDLSRAAKDIMPGAFGNPGTADAIGLGGLGVGFVTEPATTTAITAGLGGAALPYAAMNRRVAERLPEVARRLSARGFGRQEAESLAEMVVDTTRTREALDMLATRMNRADARSLLRAIRFSVAQQAGESAGDEE